MKKLFLSALVAVGLVSCVQEELVSTSNPSNEIAFSGYVGNQVRSAVDPSTTLANLDHFTVWAYVDESAGVVFNGELVQQANGEWSYEGPRYWAEGHNYRFFALTPYGKGNSHVTITGADADPYANGLGEITFVNENGTEDVLYASNVESTVSSIPEKVTFQFNHLLSKVKFTFTNGHDGKYVDLIIKNIKMEVPATATVDLDKSVKTQYAWGNHDGKLVLDFGHVDAANYLALGAVKETDNERLTIPAGADQKYKVTFTVEEWQNKSVMTEHNFETYIEGKELVAGTAYNFTAEITPEVLNLKKIVFDAKVDEWVEDGDTELGYYKEVNSNTYVVTSGDGLKRIAEEINAGVETDRNITLSEDIDLNAITRTASNWTPIGTEDVPFTGTFDGKNYTIKNLNVVETEAKEGKAYIGFFGYAKNATIKNVTFENVNINIPCLDIDHSQGHIGAVAGSLEGTSTIENVTVKGDINVYATQDANGASRVAVVAGGNSYGNVTMKNVHVIANEGSSLIANNNTGALAGQLQGKSVFENCTSNIDVTVNKFFAGGIIGLAAGDQLFVNCHTTGDIKVVAGREGRAHDQYRVGGIAGGWSDGAKNVCTLVNCSYTGEVSGKNSDGSVAEPLDYMGYVGRGYTLNGCAGSKVVIDGIEFVQVGNTAAEAGVYTVTNAEGDVVTVVESTADVKEALANGENVLLAGDVAVSKSEAGSNGYGAAGISQLKGGVIDGNGNAISVNAWGTWDSAINTTGGTIKNLKVTGGMRGIFVSHNSTYSDKVVLENVTIDGTVYTISCDQGTNKGLEAYNSTFNGWTSYAATLGATKFVGCSFGSGQGYAFCRPYAATEFVNCAFAAGYELDAEAAVSFENCTLGGVALTAENLSTLVVGGIANVTLK